jgi:hypothetical protein
MTTSNNPVGMPSSTIVLRDSTTVNRTRSNRGAIHLLATAFLSGAVFYRLGSFGGCSSLWLNSNKSYTNSISSYPNSPEYYTSTQSSDPYVHTSASRTTSDPKNDRRLIPRTSLPYDCGKSQSRTAGRDDSFSTPQKRSFHLPPPFPFNQSPRIRRRILLSHPLHRWCIHKSMVQKVSTTPIRQHILLSTLEIRD